MFYYVLLCFTMFYYVLLCLPIHPSLMCWPWLQDFDAFDLTIGLYTESQPWSRKERSGMGKLGETVEMSFLFNYAFLLRSKFNTRDLL